MPSKPLSHPLDLRFPSWISKGLGTITQSWVPDHNSRTDYYLALGQPTHRYLDFNNYTFKTTVEIPDRFHVTVSKEVESVAVREKLGMTQWHMPVTQNSEDPKLEASLGYLTRPFLQTTLILVFFISSSHSPRFISEWSQNYLYFQVHKISSFLGIPYPAPLLWDARTWTRGDLDLQDLLRQLTYPAVFWASLFQPWPLQERRTHAWLLRDLMNGEEPREWF